MGSVGWTVYDIMAPAISVAVGYVVVMLTGLIRARVKNDLARGLLRRLTESVADAVGAVNQETHALLKQARHGSSPDGRRLTKQEREALKAGAVSYVKSYWGPRGLKELARILADGEADPDAAARQVESVITTKIEAEVARQKAASIVTRTPGK